MESGGEVSGEGKRKIIPSGNTSLRGAGDTDTTDFTKFAELLLKILLRDLVLKVTDIDDL